MNPNDQTNVPKSPVQGKGVINPITVICKPAVVEEIIPERKLEDKRFEAINDIKYNGQFIEKGTIFGLNDLALVEHFARYGALKEVR